jgi:sec-independent protein translocase protein TatA
MNIFGMGPLEIVLIMAVALLIFGPKKLPEIGRSFGKTVRSFQEASNEFQNEFKREADRIEEPAKTNAELEHKQIEATTTATTTEPDNVKG